VVLAVYVQAGVEQLAGGGGREESAHLLQHVSRQRAQSEGVVLWGGCTHCLTRTLCRVVPGRRVAAEHIQGNALGWLQLLC
jgi:hypothetical protein